MRSLTLVVLSIAAQSFALAQSASAGRERAVASREQPEEIVVRGRGRERLRLEAWASRQRAFDIFNEINSDDEFDVHCREETRPGTRVPQLACRARFEERISTEAARQYMATLRSVCTGPSQACIFSEYAQSAMSAAQAVEAELPYKQELLNAEIRRLAEQDPRFGQAVLDYYETYQLYRQSRRRREE